MGISGKLKKLILKSAMVATLLSPAAAAEVQALKNVNINLTEQSQVNDEQQIDYSDYFQDDLDIEYHENYDEAELTDEEIWDEHDEYEWQVDQNTMSCKEALEQFYTRPDVLNTISHGKRTGLNTGIPKLNKKQQAVNDELKEIVISYCVTNAIKIDNWENFEAVLNRFTKFHVGPGSDSAGHVNHLTNEVFIGTTLGAGNSYVLDDLIQITVHEAIGHKVLLLGEAGTEFYVEQETGIKSFNGLNDWMYSPVFDRALHNEIGDEEYWQSRYTDEQATDAWNQSSLHEIVSAEDLKKAKTMNGLLFNINDVVNNSDSRDKRAITTNTEFARHLRKVLDISKSRGNPINSSHRIGQIVTDYEASAVFEFYGKEFENVTMNANQFSPEQLKESKSNLKSFFNLLAKQHDEIQQRREREGRDPLDTGAADFVLDYPDFVEAYNRSMKDEIAARQKDAQPKKNVWSLITTKLMSQLNSWRKKEQEVQQQWENLQQNEHQINN